MNEWEEANRAVQLHPDCADAYFARGKANAWPREDNQAAIDDFSRLLEMDGTRSDGYFERAQAKSRLKDYPGAIEDYSRALELHHDPSTVYSYRGHTHDELGDHLAAIEDYLRALRISRGLAGNDLGDSRSAYLNRSIAKGKLGDPVGAIQDCDRALQLDPNDAEAYVHRGMAKSTLGDHQGAVEDHNRALQLSPDHEDAYFYRGLAKVGLGDEQGSNEDYTHWRTALQSKSTPTDSADRAPLQKKWYQWSAYDRMYRAGRGQAGTQSSPGASIDGTQCLHAPRDTSTMA